MHALVSSKYFDGAGLDLSTLRCSQHPQIKDPGRSERQGFSHKHSLKKARQGRSNLSRNRGRGSDGNVGSVNTAWDMCRLTQEKARTTWQASYLGHWMTYAYDPSDRGRDPDEYVETRGLFLLHIALNPHCHFRLSVPAH